VRYQIFYITLHYSTCKWCRSTVHTDRSIARRLRCCTSLWCAHMSSIASRAYISPWTCCKIVDILVHAEKYIFRQELLPNVTNLMYTICAFLSYISPNLPFHIFLYRTCMW